MLQLAAESTNLIRLALEDGIPAIIDMKDILEKLTGVSLGPLDNGLDALKSLLETPKNLEAKQGDIMGQVGVVGNTIGNFLNNLFKAPSSKPGVGKPDPMGAAKALEKMLKDPDFLKRVKEQQEKVKKKGEEVQKKQKEIEELERRLITICDLLDRCREDSKNCDDDDDEPSPRRPGEGGGKGGGGGGSSGNPVDPNDIIGPVGYGDPGWISSESPLGYMIRFENDPMATLPAQKVTITQQLDDSLDFRTFRVGDFGWGDIHVQVASDLPFLNQRVDLTEQYGFYVDVTANIDVLTGLATWTLTTIDPATGDIPADFRVGFLPPDTEDGNGEGFVTYSIRAKGTVATGEVIDAEARIIFDNEPPIDTAPIFNTIDADPASSSVHPLPAATYDTDFLVQWSGADVVGGSGLANFTIYVSANGGSYAPWLVNTTLTEAVFQGAAGHAYAFFSVAKDNAGNVESPPLTPDAIIQVLSLNQAPLAIAGGPYIIFEGDQLFLDASASSDPDGDSLEYSWDLNGDGVFGDAFGATPTLSWEQLAALGIDDGDNTFEVRVRVSDGKGAVTESAATTLTVLNARPTVRIDAAPLAGVRGQMLSFTFSATDASSADQSAGFTYRIDWDNDGVIDQIVEGGASVVVQHAYLTNAEGRFFRVKVSAVDKDGAESAVVSHQLRVTNFGLQEDEENPGVMNLIYGGTAGIDSVQFISNGDDTVTIYEFFLNNRYAGKTTTVHGVTGKVIAYGQEGNDVFDARELLGKRAELHGQGGDDILYAGPVSSLLDGGEGSDLLWGGTGEDHLEGGSGNDMLIGGAGADTMHGGAGSDLLLSGSVVGEDVVRKVLYIFEEWKRTDEDATYENRVNNVRGTSDPEESFNGYNVLDAASVVGDGEVDVVFGDEGEDWFLVEVLHDETPDKAVDEVLTELDP